MLLFYLCKRKCLLFSFYCLGFLKTTIAIAIIIKSSIFLQFFFGINWKKWICVKSRICVHYFFPENYIVTYKFFFQCYSFYGVIISDLYKIYLIFFEEWRCNIRGHPGRFFSGKPLTISENRSIYKEQWFIHDFSLLTKNPKSSHFQRHIHFFRILPLNLKVESVNKSQAQMILLNKISQMLSRPFSNCIFNAYMENFLIAYYLY